MDTSKGATRTTPMTDDQVKAIEEKKYKNRIRSRDSRNYLRSDFRMAKEQLINVRSGFAQFNTTDNNSLVRTKYHSAKRLLIII